MLNDGLNGLPQGPGVFTVDEVIVDFFSILMFCLLDAMRQIDSCCFESCLVS